LKSRLNQVLGADIRVVGEASKYAAGGAALADSTWSSSNEDDDTPPAPPSKFRAAQSKPIPTTKAKATDEDTEDALSYFEKLAGDE
jgi:hypothetical protein